MPPRAWKGRPEAAERNACFTVLSNSAGERLDPRQMHGSNHMECEPQLGELGHDKLVAARQGEGRPAVEKAGDGLLDVLGAKLLRLYQVADAGGVRRR